MDEPLFNELLESVKQADQIMTDHAELRRLAKAATPGPWRVQTGCSWRRIGTDSGDGDVLRPCTHPHDGWPDIVAPAENLKYIASANPKTILALLDEIDRLKAENEALRKDAARYRWLRERDLETIRQGGVFAGMTPENIVLNLEHLDAAIDAALEGATQ
ncbi:TPA: ead/Ea22-like family protein [Pseudomonas aeruginosa]|nr:ead/Ea22-like family protein [Pseudomonas aeruginosa]HCF2029392.1 ead/Ea22-like family protein [Pseudomonas aeruginosa]HEJ4837996.1 ead/Ea22-like family protein [Pseudomonas aeruginosa]